jgi:hypothetical protein
MTLMGKWFRMHGLVMTIAVLIVALVPVTVYLGAYAASPSSTPSPAATCSPAQAAADAGKAGEKAAANLYTTGSTAMWALMWIALALIARGIVSEIAESPNGRRL